MNLRQTQIWGLEKNSVKITSVSLIVFLADLILLGSIAGISKFAAGSCHVLFLMVFALFALVLMILLVEHLIFAILSAQRRAHFLMVLLIPLIILPGLSLSKKWERYEHRRWFFETALPEYQAAVERILQDPLALKDRNRLQLRAGNPAGCLHVGGEIRADGSVFIHFNGGDHWREGYAYCSGGQMDTNTYSYLTNCWFEY